VEFEWDQAKAATNIQKHGVSFERAVLVFDDDGRIEWLDARRDYGEPRWLVIGMVDSMEFTVT
jgi:uncharacterized DUF497 family protein